MIVNPSSAAGDRNRTLSPALRESSARASGDFVVNNAGAAKRGDFLMLSEDDWTERFALKFFGAVRLLRATWPALKERKGAVVSRRPNSGSRTCRHARWTLC